MVRVVIEDTANNPLTEEKSPAALSDGATILGDQLAQNEPEWHSQHTQQTSVPLVQDLPTCPKCPLRGHHWNTASAIPAR